MSGPATPGDAARRRRCDRTVAPTCVDPFASPWLRSDEGPGATARASAFDTQHRARPADGGRVRAGRRGTGRAAPARGKTGCSSRRAQLRRRSARSNGRATRTPLGRSMGGGRHPFSGRPHPAGFHGHEPGPPRGTGANLPWPPFPSSEGRAGRRGLEVVGLHGEAPVADRREELDTRLPGTPRRRTAPSPPGYRRPSIRMIRPTSRNDGSARRGSISGPTFRSTTWRRPTAA